jgi:hypothetical protein
MVHPEREQPPGDAMHWELNFGSCGELIVVLLIATFLSKLFVQQSFKKDLERFKQELQGEMRRELESIRATVDALSTASGAGGAATSRNPAASSPAPSDGS